MHVISKRSALDTFAEALNNLLSNDWMLFWGDLDGLRKVCVSQKVIYYIFCYYQVGKLPSLVLQRQYVCGERKRDVNIA